MPETTRQTSQSKLHRNLSVWEAIGISLALMAPSMAASINPQGTATTVGRAVPVAFALAFAGVLLVAYTFVRLTQRFHHSGSVYGFVGATLGPRAGMIAGWALAGTYIFYAVTTAMAGGRFAAGFLSATGIWQTQATWPGFLFGALGMVAVWWLAVTPARGGTRVLLAAEAVTVLLILIVVVAVFGKLAGHSGPGHLGVTWSVFSLPSGTPLSTVFLGVVFGFLSFAGFEAAATLGEETRNPRRNIPRGLVYAVVLVGAIYLFCTYAETGGFGTSDGAMARLAADAAPVTTLGHAYAPWMDLLIGLAGVSSIFAVTVNSNNGIVRILYAMGREGMLPRRLAVVSPRLGTPAFAVYVQAAFAVLVTVAMGFWVGPFTTYAYLGAVLTFAIIPVYWLTNVACMRFFRRQHPEQVRPLRPVVLPVLALVLMVIPVYGSVWPVPAAPYDWFPYAVLGCIALLAAVAAGLGRRRPELLRRAGEVLAGVDESA
jgi:amino acid transporter